MGAQDCVIIEYLVQQLLWRFQEVIDTGYRARLNSPIMNKNIQTAYLNIPPEEVD